MDLPKIEKKPTYDELLEENVELKARLKEIEDKEKSLSGNETEIILLKSLAKKNRKDATIREFIKNFLICENVAQASAMTGIHPQEGQRIRMQKDVTNAIQNLVDKQAVKYGFNGSEIVKRVKEVVDVDPIHVWNPDGTVKDSMHDIPSEVRRAIRKFEAKNLYEDREDMNGMKERIIIGKLIKVEFYDKMKATELIGREKKLFKMTTKVEHDVTKNMENLLLKSAERANKAAIEVIEVRDN